MEDARGTNEGPLIHMGTLLGGQPRDAPARRRRADRSASGERGGIFVDGPRRDMNRRTSFGDTPGARNRPRACSNSSLGGVDVSRLRHCSPYRSRGRGYRGSSMERTSSGPVPERTVVAQLSGFYLVKFAVSATACYLTIQLLITFAEVLLPFIFAVLCCVVLEPLKKFIMRVFQRLAVLLFRKLQWNCCLESYAFPGGQRGRTDGDYRSDGELAYGGLPEDSAGEDVAAAAAAMSPLEAPVPAVKKLILAMSIVICMVLSGRVLWLTTKVFLRAGYSISENLEFYRQGASRMKAWFQMLVVELHFEASDAAQLLDDIVEEVENIGTVVTQNILHTVVQAVVTFIFLIYMLWSPIRMDGSSMTREVFTSTSRYLKVKCLISAFTGLSVAILLWALNLDLPAAFGLLACLANFLPGIGSVVASLLPCILAAIDVRKTSTQVLLALVLQFVVHFCIDFLIEPVFFGMSVEIHSVIVILGIWFFYQVWGVPGMLLSVPLLAVARILMRSMRQAGTSGCGHEESDTIVFLDSILEGRWMSTVGERSGEDEMELAEVAAWQHPGAPGEQGELSPGLATPELTATTPAAFQPASPLREADLWALDVWALICDSKVAKDIAQFYEANRLLVDCAVLLLICAIIIYIPL